MLVERGQQHHRGVAVAARAADHLAVHCDHSSWARRLGQVRYEGAGGGVQNPRVDQLEDPRDGALVRPEAPATPPVPARSHPREQVLGRVGDPLADRIGAGVVRRHRARDQCEHRRQRMTPAPACARILDPREATKKSRRPGLAPGARDRAECAGGHGSSQDLMIRHLNGPQLPCPCATHPTRTPGRTRPSDIRTARNPTLP